MKGSAVRIRASASADRAVFPAIWMSHRGPPGGQKWSEGDTGGHIERIRSGSQDVRSARGSARRTRYFRLKGERSIEFESCPS